MKDARLRSHLSLQSILPSLNGSTIDRVISTDGRLTFLATLVEMEVISTH